ncbi:HTH domain of SpoOJ/ParA/ParB/repB family, involved in chromosome partitioning [Clostridium sporogenes]|nr:HTH domain of SpoOJ/ParA/ParB/repB family, involved in chromosome partitioning [Clostridium sporogenes]
MTILKSFRAIRPNKGFERKIAALPYDVVNTEEAKEIGDKNPYSFLHIDRAEIDLNKDINHYDQKVYDKARENLNNMINKELFIKEEKPMLYIYSLNMNGNIQTGIVGCLSIDDYMNNVIKKHEHTREEKELDRIKHVDTCSAHTGPIFLTYKYEEKLNTIIENCTENKALYDFVAEDGVRHTVWQIDDENTTKEICHIFKTIPSVYIADGHHRAASAVKVGLKRRGENKNYTGEEEFNYFLGVLFPHKELKIMDYNRVVKDTLDYTEEEFINKIEDKFIVREYNPKLENKKTIKIVKQGMNYKVNN